MPRRRPCPSAGSPHAPPRSPREAPPRAESDAARRSLAQRLGQGFADRLPFSGETATNNFPMQGDTAGRSHTGAYGFAEPLDILSRGAAVIDQKIAMHLRHLGAADTQATTARLVDQLPSTRTRRVLECRTTGALADRLVGLARVGNLCHRLQDVW